MSNLRDFKVNPADRIVAGLCSFNWPELEESEILAAAWGYYYFSIQFRENLEIACALFPDDGNLAKLKREECQTDNLSPYPRIALEGEAMDHDMFMRRALALHEIPQTKAAFFHEQGEAYLQEIRGLDERMRGLSICHYECGGLEQLFTAMLTAPAYDNAALAAFRYFMEAHIRFDSDPIEGHGALSRHLAGDEDVSPLWDAFRRLMLALAPGLENVS